jgi:hypothetical protein
MKAFTDVCDIVAVIWIAAKRTSPIRMVSVTRGQTGPVLISLSIRRANAKRHRARRRSFYSGVKMLAAGPG